MSTQPLSQSSIKSMKLYSRVERVFAELRAAGIGDDQPIPLELLSQFDQYHYFGTRAVDEAIARLELAREHEVLDLGSGIGGPARHLAARAGCSVTAVELQADLHETAIELTRRCGLEQRIRFVLGDFLDDVVPSRRFDALVSWLAFLHIPDRERLHAACRRALKPGGWLYVEDFFERSPFTDREREDLAQKVYCAALPSLDALRGGLDDAGFVDVEVHDLSESWAEFVRGRSVAYRGARARQVELHGIEVFEGLEDFYATIVRLFEGGHFGGFRVLARRP